MRLAPADCNQAGEQSSGLRDQSDGQKINEIDRGRRDALVHHRVAGHHRQTDEAAEPVVTCRAEQLAPGHGAWRKRGQKLQIPGPVPDLADHRHAGIARAPNHDDGVVKPARPGGRAVFGPARKRGREEREREQCRHHRQPARRQFEPQIALKFRAHGLPTCAK